MGNALGTLGMNAANAAGGGLLGMIFGGINDRRQINQQQKLQDMQIRGQKELTDYNTVKQMEMWKNTSFPAQLAMMKAAGLSPGLMYGGSGGGGATAQIAQGNVSGGDAPKGGGEMMGMAGMGIQMATLEIQKKLADIAEKQTASNVEKQGAETAGIKIDTKFKDRTFENRDDLIRQELNRTYQEVDIKTLESAWLQSTSQDRVEQVALEVAGQRLSNDLLKADIRLTEKQREGIIQSINTQIKQLEQRDTELAQGKRALDQGDKRLIIEEARNELIETGIWVNGISNALGTAADVIMKGRSLKQGAKQYERSAIDRETRTEKMKSHNK